MNHVMAWQVNSVRLNGFGGRLWGLSFNKSSYYFSASVYRENNFPKTEKNIRLTLKMLMIK